MPLLHLVPDPKAYTGRGPLLDSEDIFGLLPDNVEVSKLVSVKSFCCIHSKLEEMIRGFGMTMSPGMSINLPVNSHKSLSTGGTGKIRVLAVDSQGAEFESSTEWLRGDRISLTVIRGEDDKASTLSIWFCEKGCGQGFEPFSVEI